MEVRPVDIYIYIVNIFTNLIHIQLCLFLIVGNEFSDNEAEFFAEILMVINVIVLYIFYNFVVVDI